MSYKKTILTTILYTFLSLLVVLGVVAVLMFFVFTSATADFMYNIGCEKVASNLYSKSYDKTGDIKYCYKALNLKITLNESSDVVELYEKFINDNEYADFMQNIKTNSEKINVGVLERSSLLNEENYLTTRYVRALIKIGEGDKAWGVATNEFAEYEGWSLTEQGVYALGEFVSENNVQKFNTLYVGFDETLIVEMQTCFDSLINIFNNNKDTTNDLNKAYLVALGNRIINIGQNINNLYGDESGVADNKTNNLNTMIEINDVIKGLI